ncbi:MAG: hypothetical protein G8237_01520 [Magnetococcales bacterium]|nr:hypothetical protein [Magnetococcales bacterium]NGZ05016.1 hypothetical protein [Magnetococcales bacterium]
MAEGTTDRTQITEVPLWWRKLNAVELQAVVRARRAQQLPLSVRPGLGGETRRLLAHEQEYHSEGVIGTLARRWRLLVLEAFNAKLNRVVERTQPGEDALKPHPFAWHDSGDGLTFWMTKEELTAGDLLEMRFAPFPDQPLPIHAYCRVEQVRRDWNGTAVRVECRFATMELSEREGKKLSAPSGSSSSPTVTEPSSVLPVALHSESQEHQTRVDQRLMAAKAILEADPRQVAAHVTPPAPPPSRPLNPRLAAQAADAAMPVMAVGSKRQDFRLNDNLPLAWKVLTQKSFDHAVNYFNAHREFPLRERVVRQKRLLAEVDVQLKLLRQLNVKARRPVVWFREFLDRRFRQANSENEEEYFQGCLMLFFGLIKEMTKRPPGSMSAAQVVSLIQNQLDTRMSQQQLDPLMEKLHGKKLAEDLEEIKRQIGKLIGELRAAGSVLVETLEGFRAAIVMIDFSGVDQPKQLTAEGDAIFTVNLSATGVAWSTSKTNVYKGDLVEVRLGVDPEGQGLEPIWAYGRVVVVQEPDEQGKRRVASFFEHMSPLHREKLQNHIVRRQRAELARRANAAS